MDVEGFRRVARQAAGREICDVRVFDAQVLRGTSARTLRAHLRGQRFGEPRRHGKWLVLPVAGTPEAVLLHFGMTGSLHWDEPLAQRHRHDRVEFGCDGGALCYRDMRKLKGLHFAPDSSAVDTVLAGLGPDAAAVTRSQLRDALGARRRQLKAALMDQEVLAGLGNLMVDEILWRAGLHPRRSTAALETGELARLHARMGTVLRQGSRAERVPDHPSWLTGHRDAPDGRCPRCHTPLEYGRVGSRSTVWCPRCQPER